jgi:hypothetical protein
VSVLSTSVTKQTGDMVYSEARRRRFLSFGQRTTMLYACEARQESFPTNEFLAIAARVLFECRESRRGLRFARGAIVGTLQVGGDWSNYGSGGTDELSDGVVKTVRDPN